MGREAFATWLHKSKGSMPGSGMVARHTAWYDIGTIDFTTNALNVGDRWYHGDSGDVEIKITPGTFRVQAKGAAFDKHHRVAIVRVFKDGTQPIPGKTLGEINVDSWGILIGSLHDLYRDFTDESTREKWWKKNLFGKYADGVEIKLHKVSDRTVPFVTAFTGLGSGGYPARALLVKGKKVGVQVEFIEEGIAAP